MFPVLVFASHFQILVRKPDTRPECFTTHLVAPYRYISFGVQYTVCIHTQNDIWTPETEISDHKFPFCPSAPHV
jgi:hypothetical protein